MDRSRRHFHLRAVCFLALLASPGGRAQIPGNAGAPAYTAEGIVHAASQTATLAPNGIATIYGSNLAFATHALAPSDLLNGDLPLSLEGVTVYVNGIPANLFYVSPGQVNFLVPYEITASTATVYVNRRGLSGPGVRIPLATAAPAFFQWNGSFAVAQHADGTLISLASPAKGGEIIVLFAAGLGRTSPDISSGYVARKAAPILYLPQLQVSLDGVALPAVSIYYAGLTPGFAGLYQVNLKLPEAMPLNPEIRISVTQQLSPAGIRLYTQQTNTQ